MFDNWFRNWLNRPAMSADKNRRLRLEALEDRTVMATLTVTIPTLTAFPEGTGGKLSGSDITVNDSDPTVTTANVSATIDWGDGTGTSSVALTSGGSGLFFFSPVHTFLEESGTSSDQTFTVTVTATDSKNSLTSTQTAPIAVPDALLSAGNPVPTGPGQQFFGGATGSSTTTTQAFTNFKAAIGGADQSAATGLQSSGFRTINWDGVKLDGTDFGGGANTTVITQGKTIGIPLDRFQTRGVFFGAVYAVSNDGFADVNPSVGGTTPLFPAFSPKNTFAMFNDNGIDFKFVVPSPSNSTVVSAGSRGFGAIFLNVQKPGTNIQYFHDNELIDTLDVPVNSTPGAAQFAGELFNNPIVTNIQLNLGEGVIFSFDGTNVTSGSPNSLSNNLVAVDDFAYPEPVPINDGFPIVSGPAGVINAQVKFTAQPMTPFSGVAGTFSDSDPNANAKDYTATINWGDGHLINGTIKANNQGGFDVSGTNTYLEPGVYNVNVDIMDFGGSQTSVSNVTFVGTANQRLVNQMYLDLLGRESDLNGLLFWSAKLDAGQSAQSVALGIEGSAEYDGIVVQNLFQHYLRRAADPSGLSFFTGQLQGGQTVEQVTLEIVTSPEYLAKRGGGTNDGALAALFQDALGRPIDSAGQTFYDNQFANGSTFSDVAKEIFASTEYSGHIIDVLFQDYLRRHADASGVAFFSTIFNAPASQGDPFENTVAGILGSTEYNSKAQANPLLLPPVPFDPFQASLP